MMKHSTQCHWILATLVIVTLSAATAMAHNPTAEDMAIAANRFLSSLTSEQIAQTKFKLSDAERENYHFEYKPAKKTLVSSSHQ